jgi:rod shape-determining protein MreC
MNQYPMRPLGSGSRRPVARKKILSCVLAFLLAWWLLPLAAKCWLHKGFYELQAPMWYIHSCIDDLQTYWAMRLQGSDSLIESGRDLARLAASYELAAQRELGLSQEVNRLEKIAALVPEPGWRCENVRVIHRDLGTWWHTLMIRKNPGSEMHEGMLVVQSWGVVGRIVQVHAYTAIVELVSSPRFRIPVNIEGDPRPMLYQGSFVSAFETPVGSIGHVPADMAVLPSLPRRVVTGGFSQEYPEGLTIGWIKSLELGSDGLFQWGSVLLPNQIQEVREVAILIPERNPAP